MVATILSRRAALAGLLAVPAFGLVRSGAAAPLCGGVKSGAVQASGASTVCDFVTQTLADGSLSSVSFSDFTIKDVARGARIEKVFWAYHTFASAAGADARAHLSRVALDGAFVAEGVSGTTTIDVRVGALNGQRSWRIEDGDRGWTFGLEGRRQVLRNGEVFPIVVKTTVRVGRVAERGFFNLAVDGLSYAHA